jgi:hypothetical protein
MFSIVLASCFLGQFGGGVNRVAGVIDPTTGLPRFAIRDANGLMVSPGAFVTLAPSPGATTLAKSVPTKSAATAKAKAKPKQGKIKPKSANERIALKREFMWALGTL